MNTVYELYLALLPNLENAISEINDPLVEFVKEDLLFLHNRLDTYNNPTIDSLQQETTNDDMYKFFLPYFILYQLVHCNKPTIS